MTGPKIYHNCRILTGFEPLTFRESLAVSGGEIVKIGPFEKLMRDYPRAELIDLHNRTVIPPFYDGHVHFEFGGFLRKQPSLENINEKDALEIIASAAEKPKAHSSDEWIILGMYEKSSGFLNRELLDKIEKDRPLLILTRDLHAAVLNTSALDRLNLDDYRKRGFLNLDRSGKFDGTILETAVEETFNHAHKPDRQEIKRSLLAAQELALEHGITGVSDNVNKNIADAYKELEKEGKLKIKVDAWMNSNDFDPASLEFDRYESEQFRLNTVKGFLDGSFASATAYLREPFRNRKDCGVKRIDYTRLKSFISQAGKNHLRIALHAIGDAAADLALAALRDAQIDTSQRHRLEHLQLLRPEHLELMKEMKIIASVQPVHLGYDWQTSESLLGQDRCKYIYPFKSISDAGIELAFGTDWPVADIDPRRGIYSAVTRKDRRRQPPSGWFPQERMNVFSALRAYSSGSKFAAGWLKNSLTGVNVEDKFISVVNSAIFEKEIEKGLTVKPELIIL
ncbi:MAG: amidohydrolase family protein [FCB group bacterium]|nr:amidohydrolase family protein [FCB group bacterium]